VINLNHINHAGAPQNKSFEPIREEASNPLPAEVVVTVTAAAVLLVLVFGAAIFWCRKWPNGLFKKRVKQSSTVSPLEENF
jgi:hypothetical protein